MEEQVTASKQPGAYYEDPNGPRYENPADFSAATGGQRIPQPQQPPMPNFEEMRKIAMQQAIEQIAAQRAAQPQPQPQPQISVTPPQPPAQYQFNIEQPIEQPIEQQQIVRRNLTKPELIAVFVVACIAVTGVQTVWNFATNILPRIEIRAN